MIVLVASSGYLEHGPFWLFDTCRLSLLLTLREIAFQSPGRNVKVLKIGASALSHLLFLQVM